MKILIIYAAVIGAMSVIAFFTYLADKIKAIKGAWRIRESVLLGMGILGGAPGALIAMNVCRHKTRHVYFWIINIAALLVQIGGAVAIFVFLV